MLFFEVFSILIIRSLAFLLVQQILGRRDFENRIERFVHVVKKNLGEKLLQAKEIDMRYTNGFAVRWKQHTTEYNESGVK